MNKFEYVSKHLARIFVGMLLLFQFYFDKVGGVTIWLIVVLLVIDGIDGLREKRKNKCQK